MYKKLEETIPNIKNKIDRLRFFTRNEKMIYTKTFEWHHGLIFNYWKKWHSYPNPHDNNKYWQCEETWFVGIQAFSPFKWFGYDRFYYDGHKGKVITILGVRFTKGYSYQAERIV
jgi:hypothetical protein